jgi:hypothetical protein
LISSSHSDQVEDGTADDKLAPPVPSPDGRKLAFVDRAVDSDVWLWQVDAR